MSIVVFDFDKTLSKGDTFNQFVFFSIKEIFFNINFFKFIILVFKCLYEYFCIFLKYKSVIDFKTGLLNLIVPHISNYEDHILNFSKTIKLNLYVVNLLKKYLLNKQNKVFIVSASDEFMIRCLFNDVEVIGMKMDVENNKKNLKIIQHPFSDVKVKLLNRLFQISKIDIFYTDSLNDLPCINISNCSYLVNGNKLTRIDK